MMITLFHCEKTKAPHAVSGASAFSIRLIILIRLILKIVLCNAVIARAAAVGMFTSSR